MAADTWSIGVILFVFLAGYLPFDEPTMSALFRKIQAADFEYPTWFSNEVKDVLNKILIPDPVKRLTLQQITALDWYNVDGKLYFILSSSPPTPQKLLLIPVFFLSFLSFLSFLPL